MDGVAIHERYLIDLYPHRGLTFVRGDGVFLETGDGRRYLDMMTNYGVNIFGYGHPALTRALIEQTQRLPTLHGSFGNDVRARASRSLLARLPVKPGYLYWANSGAEAVEAALKFAVLATGRKRFVACADAYHGKTLGALSATSGRKYREAFEPLLWRFTHVPFGDLDSLAGAIDDDTAAFLVEPIQGESGVIVPPAGYLRAVRELCSARGILLILDEVQTGCGRTGAFGAAEHDGVVADVVCLGKGLAGGIPVGATVVNEAVAAAIPRGVHTSTFGGNPLACAGVLAVLECLDDAMLGRVARTGDLLRTRLRGIAHDLVAAVRGRGLMIGVEVRDQRDSVLKGMQRAGVLAIPAGASVVRFLPSYLIEDEHVERVAGALEQTLRTLAPA